MNEVPKVYRIGLKKGVQIEHATIAYEAPQIAGFIAVRCKVLDEATNEKQNAIRYISQDNITEMIIEVEQLEAWSTSVFIPEKAQKVKLEDSF